MLYDIPGILSLFAAYSNRSINSSFCSIAVPGRAILVIPTVGVGIFRAVYGPAHHRADERSRTTPDHQRGWTDSQLIIYVDHVFLGKHARPIWT
jgi:hypothetical protein